VEFHGTRIDATAHRAAATTHGIIKSTSGTRDGIEKDEHMFSGFDQSFGAFDRQLRNPRVTLYVGVVGAGHQLRRRMANDENQSLLRDVHRPEE